MVNRFWLNATPSGTPTAAQVLALSDAVAASFRTRFGAQLNTNWHQTAQRTVMYVSSTLEIGVDGSDAGSGSDAGTTDSPQLCYLINWSIAGTYRGGHPRTYLAGTTVGGTQGDGTINTTKRANLTTAAGNFLTDVNALSPTGFSAVQLGTIRFFRGHTALSPPVFEPFLSGACHPRVATQRRRAGT